MMKPNDFIQPGVFRLFYGPMYSGKTQALNRIIGPIRILETKGLATYGFFKPEEDNRKTRTIDHPSTQAVLIPKQAPGEIYATSRDKDAIFIDEIMMFDDEIVDVVGQLIRERKYIVGAGLNLNFRGEWFGPMKDLTDIASFSGTLTFLDQAVCYHPGCGKIATRTQRYLNGKPAPYNDPEFIVEDNDNSRKYYPACEEHHKVPEK
jgi:thymidine kinase